MHRNIQKALSSFDSNVVKRIDVEHKAYIKCTQMLSTEYLLRSIKIETVNKERKREKRTNKMEKSRK